MRIVLIDRNPDVVKAWQSYGYEGFEGDLFEVGNKLFTEQVALVSPANSFGFMDGGVDQRILDYLGKELQDEVQSRITDEILIGEYIITDTSHDKWRWLISAPTMRVPMAIRDANDIFLAARAARRGADELEIEALVFTGMGTATGRLDPYVAAHHMISGIQQAEMPYPPPVSLSEAYQRQVHPRAYIYKEWEEMKEKANV